MATKIKDGLFLGDIETAADYEFLAANKVTRVVNCCGREAANAWEDVSPAGGGFGSRRGYFGFGRFGFGLFNTDSWHNSGMIRLTN